MLEKTKRFTKAAIPWAALLAAILAMLQGYQPTPAPVDPDPIPVVESHAAPYAKLTAPATGVVGEPIVVSAGDSLGKSIKLFEQGYSKETGWYQEAFDANGQPIVIFMAREPLTLHSTLVVTQGDESDIAQAQTVFTGKTPVDPPPPPEPPKPPIDPPKPVVGDAKALVVVMEKSVSSPLWKSADVTAYLAANGITLYEYSTAMVVSNADPVAMKWVGESAAGSNKSYPYIFVADATGNILERGDLERLPVVTSGALVDLLKKHLKNPKTMPLQPRAVSCPTCPYGGCR